jgi:hypothetical protein
MVMAGRTLNFFSATIAGLFFACAGVNGNAQSAQLTPSPTAGSWTTTSQFLATLPRPAQATADRRRAILFRPEDPTQQPLALAKPTNAGVRANVSGLANFPQFQTTPYVSATFAGDENPVYVAVSGHFSETKLEVITMQLDGALNVLVNDGKGNYSLSFSNTAATSNTSRKIVGAAVGDLDGDGYDDVVFTDAGTNSLLVYLNNGDGTFGAPASISVAPPGGASFATGGSIAIADVNGDGKLDVVTLSSIQNANTLSTTFTEQTFLGNGDGTFKALTTTTNTTLPGQDFIGWGQSIQLSDLNGDHVPDLVVDFFNNFSQSFSVASSLGKPDGTFTQFQSPLSVPGAPLDNAAFQVTDLNNDGHPDVVFLSGAGSAYVALGKGDGSFSQPTASLTNVGRAYTIQLGDLNSDGCPDLLLYYFGSIRAYPGNCVGGFSPIANGEYGGNSVGSLAISAQEPAPSDFDGDGKLDVAYVDPYYGTLSIDRGNGDGSFQAQRVIVPSNDSPTLPNNTEVASNFAVITTGDVIGNGTTGILAADFTNTTNGAPDIDIGISDGRGGFTFSTVMSSETYSSIGSEGIFTTIADFNHDGHFDLLMAGGSSKFEIALSQPDGTFTTATPIVLPVPTASCGFGAPVIRDINGDGNLDIVLPYAGNGSGCFTFTGSGYFVLLGDGKGNFNATYTPLGQLLYQIVLGDYDGDGKLDMAVDDGYANPNTSPFVCVSCGTSILVVHGNGDGTFDANNAVTVLGLNGNVGWRISGIVPGDYDADGKQDLTLLSEGFSTQPDPSQLPVITPGTQGVALLKGNGDLTFGTPTVIAPNTNIADASYMDINGDGLPDLALGVRASYEKVPTFYGITVLQNMGKGSFGPPMNLLSPGNAYFINVGDFNGDGLPDILATGQPSAVFINEGGSSLALAATPTAVMQGNNVVLQATVTVLNGSPAPGGTVTFSANNTQLGTATLDGLNVVQLIASALPVGTDVITASYSGDANHTPATALPLNVTVQPLPPSFSISATPEAVNVKAGQPGNVTLQFATNATFNGTIAVACSGLPTGATCSFNPASGLSLAGGQTGSVQVTIRTTGFSNIQTSSAEFPSILIRAASTLAITPAALIFLWPGRRRKFVLKLGLWTTLVFGLFILLQTTGCGGGSSNKNTANGGGSQANSTPVGSSLITVTATTTANGTSLMQTAVVSLVVTN